MSSNAVESSGQRFLGWINRQQQRPGEPVSAGAANATGARERAKAEQLKVWEDEGGALADRAARDRAVPALPADPRR